MKAAMICRPTTSLAMALLTWAILLSVAKAADDPPKDDQESGKHTWNDVAQSLFKKLDSHGHKFLDKAEFKKANAALDKVIRDLIKQGEIGQAPAASTPRRRFGNQPTVKAPDFEPTFATADADHDGKVTQAEFTAYVNAAIQAADQFVQAQNANSQNQPTGVPSVHGRR